MKHQIRKSNFIRIIFVMSMMTSSSIHARDQKSFNPFTFGTSSGIFNLAQSANSMVIQSPGFAGFAARNVPKQYAYIFQLPYRNSYTQYINAGVNQFLSGGSCSLGSRYCRSLKGANSLFSYNSSVVQGLAEKCIKNNGYEACKKVGF